MSDPAQRLGTVVASKYRLDEELGRGGMGVVYRVFHLRVHKTFALKMLLGEMAQHRSVASRFLLEAQAAGRIGHPGILEVYDVGEDADGAPFIVMELLRGEALSVLVRRERLDIDAACWIAMEVLDVLDAAHRAGIIHRDVKPQNVFITDRSLDPAPASGGTSGDRPSSARASAGNLALPLRGVKLLDFGIAKFAAAPEGGSAITRSGEIIGSPLYMAPEQAKGEPDLDERADVWSVGAMLFEMLTGNCAHAATSPVAVLAKILTEPAPPPSARDARVPPELDVIVQRALAIDRAARWPNAVAMRDALAELREKRGSADKTPRLPPAARTSTPPTSMSPASQDRTPGAISSTIAAPSESPARPRSGPPGKPAAQPPPAVAPSERADAPAAERGRTKRSLPVLLGVAAAALASAFVLVRLLQGSAPAGPSAVAPEAQRPASSARAADQVAAPQPSALPSASATSASAVAEPPSVPGVAASSLPSVRTAASKQDAAAAPVCAPFEVASRGHCCARGQEWQNGRCERPLATTF